MRSVAATTILSDWLLMADCAFPAIVLALVMRSLLDDWSGTFFSSAAPNPLPYSLALVMRSVVATTIFSDWLLMADCAFPAIVLALVMRSLLDDWSGLVLLLSSPPVPVAVLTLFMKESIFSGGK
ncbi:hypothetical protein Hanom_Chr16g01517491 [Helianthus anomalus]